MTEKFDPEPHRRLVTTLAGNGNSHVVIASIVQCSEPTLRKYFRAELTDAKERLVAMMGAAVVSAAMGGNVNAMKYWLSTHGGPEWRMRWRDEADEALAMANGENGERRRRIYIPANHRDEPDDDDGPIIEGEAEAA